MSSATSATARIADLKPAAEKDVQSLPAVNVGFTSLSGFELVQRAARMLASSTLVPKEYIGNIPNCAIALNMAMRVGADPLMVMQNLVIVHGRPTWSAQFLIATVNTSGRFTALRYEFFGQQGEDSWGCRAWAIEKATGEKLVGTDVTIAIAKKEGWFGKSGSKWQSIPQQMLMYRAGSWWTRAYAPELSMGLQTADEMIDVFDASKGGDGSYSVDLSDLRNQPEAPANTAATTVIDPTTGEVIDQAAQPAKATEKPEDQVLAAHPAPKAIPMKGMADDNTQPDIDGWSEAWTQAVASAQDTAWLKDLRKKNETLLKSFASRNPAKHAECLAYYDDMVAALEGKAGA